MECMNHELWTVYCQQHDNQSFFKLASLYQDGNRAQGQQENVSVNVKNAEHVKGDNCTLLLSDNRIHTAGYNDTTESSVQTQSVETGKIQIIEREVADSCEAENSSARERALNTESEGRVDYVKQTNITTEKSQQSRTNFSATERTISGSKQDHDDERVSSAELKTTDCDRENAAEISAPVDCGIHKEAATVTDICNSENLPEVQILSLIEDRIPQYRLRVDGCYGYDNHDFIQTPVLDPATDLDLSPDQIDGTLRYFVLCGDRLTQMTKVYQDIDAVTRLLEEKEYDLELAAKIGQILLEKNRDIQEQNQLLESHVSVANEKISQLKHEVGIKDDLLRFYDENLDVRDSGSCSPGHINLADVDVHDLQKKVQSLQDENLHLKLETVQLQTDTKSLEEKEERLMNDTVHQLCDVNEQLEVISDELIKKTEENFKQKEKITNLLATVVDTKKKDRSLTVENMELSQHLQSARTHQKQLCTEISSLQDRYDELLQMFESTQRDLKSTRVSPKVIQHHYLSSQYLAHESLASELDASLRAGSDYSKQSRHHNWRVFETARAVKAQQRLSRDSNPTMHQSPSTSCLSTQECPSDDDIFSEGYSADCDSNASEVNQDRSTPDSLLSPVNSLASGSRSMRGHINPEKLLIVKPMEGSLILRQWQQLARPHLGRIFDVHPGVNVRGERKMGAQDETTVYSMSDVEEDDDSSVLTQLRDDTSAIYTMTDSLSRSSPLNLSQRDNTTLSTQSLFMPQSHIDSTPQNFRSCHRRSDGSIDFTRRDDSQFFAQNRGDYKSNYASPGLSNSLSPISDDVTPKSLLRRENLEMFSTPRNKQSYLSTSAIERHQLTPQNRSHSVCNLNSSLNLTQGDVSAARSLNNPSQRTHSMVSTLPGSNTSLSKLKSSSRLSSNRGLSTIFHDHKSDTTGVISRRKSRSPVKTETETFVFNANTCHIAGEHTHVNGVTTKSNASSGNLKSSAFSTSTDTSACALATESPLIGASNVWNKLRGFSVYGVCSRAWTNATVNRSRRGKFGNYARADETKKATKSQAWSSLSASVPDLMYLNLDGKSK